MAEILSVVRQFFDEDDWAYRELPEGNILATGFQGSSATWQCYAEVREDQQRFIFYSILGSNATEERRLAVAEYVTRANFGLAIGNFELDMDDGEVRYKTSIDVEGDRLTPALVKMMIYANVTTVDHYYGGLMKVMYGGASPAAAIAEVEG